MKKVEEYTDSASAPIIKFGQCIERVETLLGFLHKASGMFPVHYSLEVIAGQLKAAVTLREGSVVFAGAMKALTDNAAAVRLEKAVEGAKLLGAAPPRHLPAKVDGVVVGGYDTELQATWTYDAYRSKKE